MPNETEIQKPLPQPAPSTFTLPVMLDVQVMDYYEKQRWLDDLERRIAQLRVDAQNYAERHGMTVVELGMT